MGLTVSRVNEVLHYDPDTGHFTWRLKTCRKTVVGKRAGALAGGSRRYIGIDGNKYHEHRLAFLIVTGSWPEGDVDHIDGDPSNNRWSNLRPASRTMNLGNQKRRKDNRSGHKGVMWDSQKRQWYASIRRDNKKYHLGYFQDPAQAHKAYMDKAVTLFGEFACNGER